jgi:hypothetical protein
MMIYDVQISSRLRLVEILLHVLNINVNIKGVVKMDPIIGGSLITAGSSLLGGLIGSRSQSSANDKNIALSKEMAQNSIQYKVADAKKSWYTPSLRSWFAHLFGCSY